MTTIERLRVDEGPVDGRFWPRIAADIVAAWSSRGIAARDAVVLVPHAGLLSAVRAAFAAQGVWLPRIETPRTLAASLGPAPRVAAEGPTLDVSIDRVSAAGLLQRRVDRARELPSSSAVFAAAVAGFVDTGHELVRAAWTVPPEQREAWWASWREALPPAAGPGAIERSLARVAVEWAVLATHDPWCQLWSLRPKAWVGLQMAGADALIERLLERAASQGVPCWSVQPDTPHENPFDAAAACPSPRRRVAHQPEDEAQGAAWAVLDDIDHGRVPVALVAEDRLVVRRVRALLERAGVAIADETGWTLSTTRAAARLMAVLRGVTPQAGRDDLLEAIKAETPASDAVNDAITALEAAWRSERTPADSARAFEQAVRTRLAALRGTGQRALLEWLDALRQAAPVLLTELADDPAGRAVLATLKLDGSPHDKAWQTLAEATRLDLAGFIAWACDALDAASYVPPAPPEPAVIIAPLARAILRPFGAAVFPGCDAAHLGAGGAVQGWLPDPVRAAHGLRDAGQRRREEMQAFAQLLRLPRVTLIRRTHDGSEPIAQSPLVELALLARRRAGVTVEEETFVDLPSRTVALMPQARPAPSMADAMPLRLTASAAEALRDCPYRFFARSALGLSETDELEVEPDKRDHGRWLHAVLQAFHEGRRDRLQIDRAGDRQRLLEAAAAVDDLQGHDAAGAWPFRAAFETFADHYLDWLATHEASGWRYVGGELPRRVAPPEWQGIALEGRLDRIDVHANGQAMVIDYKTGSADALKRRIASPLEDTQLAAYAAMLTEEASEPPPRAIYLALDDRKAPLEVEHPDPALSAARWIEGLAADLDALRQGHGAAALGEDETCEHCEMRGLCRRDHWSAR